MEDGAYIPADENNADYQKYIEWVNQGNSASAASADPLPTVQSLIDAIERDTLMNRAVREFILLSAESAASAQGVPPAQLYAANPAYKAVKDTDTAISLLRDQL